MASQMLQPDRKKSATNNKRAWRIGSFSLQERCDCLLTPRDDLRRSRDRAVAKPLYDLLDDLARMRND